MFAACNGPPSTPGGTSQNNGFDLESAFGGPPNPEYVYVPHDESKPYFDLAKEFVLADRMFQSHLDESFVSHQYIIAGQAHGSIEPFPTASGAATAVSTTRCRRSRRRVATAHRSARASTIARWATNSTSMASPGTSTRAPSTATAASGPAIRRSNTSATARTGAGRHQPADPVLHGPVERLPRERHLDHAGLRDLRPRQLRRQRRPVVGGVARERRR